MRVGLGVDAHRFCEGRPLVLGGVELDYGMGLAGHSDADVGLHAVMDALLGACGAGDIGEHFPDTDESFRGASSLELLGRVGHLLESKGCSVVNIDLVLVCEEPRVSDARAEMERRIAGACGMEPARVSVKGTTSEGMGFTGRGEGIAAVAVALVDGGEYA